MDKKNFHMKYLFRHFILIISSINSLVDIKGFHFNFFLAFEKSPLRKSTSVGLRNLGSKSIITFFVSDLLLFHLYLSQTILISKKVF